jgi:hypothetical protein
VSATPVHQEEFLRLAHELMSEREARLQVERSVVAEREEWTEQLSCLHATLEEQAKAVEQLSDDQRCELSERAAAARVRDPRCV